MEDDTNQTWCQEENHHKPQVRPRDFEDKDQKIQIKASILAAPAKVHPFDPYVQNFLSMKTDFDNINVSD